MRRSVLKFVILFLILNTVVDAIPNSEIAGRLIENYQLDDVDVKLNMPSMDEFDIFVENKMHDVVFDGYVVIEVYPNITTVINSNPVSVFNSLPVIYKDVKHIVVGPYGVKKVVFEIPLNSLNLMSNQLIYNVFVYNDRKQLIGYINAHTSPITMSYIIDYSLSSNWCYINRDYSNIGGSYGSAGPLIYSDEIEGYLSFVCSHAESKPYTLKLYVCDYWDSEYFINPSNCKMVDEKQLFLSKSSKGVMLSYPADSFPYDANALLFILKDKNNRIEDMFVSRLITNHTSAHLIEWVWSKNEHFIEVYATYTGPYFPVISEGYNNFSICVYYLNGSSMCKIDDINVSTDRVVFKIYKFKDSDISKICINSYCKSIIASLYDADDEQEYETLFMKSKNEATASDINITLSKRYFILYLLGLILIVILIIYLIVKHINTK